ncbi:Alpha/Beta hydrolase protein, partial [Fusarium oxysporum f. sp. albedinis]
MDLDTSNDLVSSGDQPIRGTLRGTLKSTQHLVRYAQWAYLNDSAEFRMHAKDLVGKPGKPLDSRTLLVPSTSCLTPSTHVYLGIRNKDTLVLAFSGIDFPWRLENFTRLSLLFGLLRNTLTVISFGLTPLSFRETPTGWGDNGLAGSFAHEGFLEAFNNLEQKLLKEIRALMGGEPRKVEICGHGFGGALATLCALWCKIHWPHVDTTCVTLGSPRVGDENFATAFSRRNINCYRFIIPSDPILTLPDRHTDTIPFQILPKKKFKIGWREPLFGDAPAWRHVGRTIVLRRSGAYLHIKDDEADGEG